MSYPRIFSFIFIMIICAVQILNINVSAGSEGAEMEDVKLNVIPNTQGLGGTVSITASISFFGGCCYPLFAYDIKATIFIPDNIELIKGKITNEIDCVEAVEGGAPTVINFKWIIKSIIPGNYKIRVNVTTSNCGKSSAEIIVRYVEGCSISIPEIYPDFPYTDQETYINIDVSSGLESVEVKSVRFYYIRTSKDSDFDMNNIKADNDTLIIGGKERHGNFVNPERVEYRPNSWKGIIPEQNEDCEIYYWFVATDNTGKNTTSVVYSFEVLEIKQIYSFVDLLTWLPIIGTIIGILILMVLFKNQNQPISEKRPLLIGSSFLKDLQSDKSDEYKQKSARVYRNIILILLFIISLILLIWAIYSGHFEEFTELNGGL